ncbi:Transcriptional regulator, Cro/CI family [Vagococcus fluvialis bH819]|uniref:Transcriptional regulator, Cro/CI family n=1 Tax=Vagococcus fluvialis bH819 TaxID=1255619 RepID=A0A1X6WL03_9ENTE|nr:Transcriptional regulator, Cro/CI family [Vagococcus fluvialis bH819]
MTITVKNQIKEIREERGIKQNEMANSLGVSRQTMTAIEKMKYNPSLELSLKIASYFDLSVEEIFELNSEV